jgi:hypothetical protein
MTVLYVADCSIILSFVSWAGVKRSPLLQKSLIGLLYQPWMIDGDDCGAIRGMNE